MNTQRQPTETHVSEKLRAMAQEVRRQRFAGRIELGVTVLPGNSP